MKRYIIFWIACVFLCGCSDFLTVKPKSDIKDIDLFSTAEGVEDALYGSYAGLGSSGTYGRSMRYFIPEFLAQSYRTGNLSESSWGLLRNYKHDSKSARKEYSTIWTSMYSSIGQINNILENLEKAESGKYRYHYYYEGEALGIRAFLHFDLLRLFAPHIGSNPTAQGIPYVTAWTNRVTPFSSVEQVYKFIIRDLKQAELLLEKAEGTEDDGKTTFLRSRQLHFNLDAARATLARVYWMKGELDSALVYAEEVIATEKYKLLPRTSVRNMLASIVANDETIWGIYQREPFASTVEDFYQTTSGCLPREDITSFYIQSGSSVQDGRESWFRTRTPNLDGDKEVYFLKLFDEKNYRDKEAPNFGGKTGFSLIRIPEMYYIAAEALLEKDPEKARTYFDIVTKERGRIPLQELGIDLTLEELNQERFREFFGEGYEWYNMKRQNRDLYLPATAETVKGTDAMYTLTIPYEEFDYRDEE